jgi:hypothetical protein
MGLLLYPTAVEGSFLHRGQYTLRNVISKDVHDTPLPLASDGMTISGHVVHPPLGADAPGGQKIAIVTALTKVSIDYMGLALVLQQSVLDHGGQHPWDFVCLVPSDAKDEELKPLTQAGWKITRAPMPVKVSEIEGPLKDVIEHSGCCGPSELIKLKVFSLTDYKRAIFFDADALVLRSLDNLVNTDATQYVLDDGLGGGCINGGFLATSPSTAVYDGLVDTVHKGNFDVHGRAWGGKNVGWCWGGQTFQGVVPYYFQYVHNSTFEPLDNWHYNNMGKHCPNHPGEDIPFEGPGIDDVVTAHFTWCQKPFRKECGRTPVCQGFFHRFWTSFDNAVARNGGNNAALKRLSGTRVDKAC